MAKWRWGSDPVRVPVELVEAARRAMALVEGGAPASELGEGPVLLVMDPEEAGVVLDALVAHQLASSRRHAEAVERGDTVSTTDERARICIRLVDRLLRQTM